MFGLIMLIPHDHSALVDFFLCILFVIRNWNKEISSVITSVYNTNTVVILNVENEYWLRKGRRLDVLASFLKFKRYYKKNSQDQILMKFKFLK